MPTIYRYTPAVTSGPNGQTIRHADPDEVMTRLCRLDGQEYLSLPTGTTLPTQPAEITLESVTLTDELRARIKRHAGPLQVSKDTTRRHIREIAGDPEDQIADLERRLGIAERLLYRMSEHVLQNNAVPQTLSDDYLADVQNYNMAIESGTAFARSDMEDKADMQGKLMERSTQVAQAASGHVQRIGELVG